MKTGDFSRGGRRRDFNVRWRNRARHEKERGDGSKESPIGRGSKRRYSLWGDDMHVVSGNVVNCTSCHEERQYNLHLVPLLSQAKKKSEVF